MAEYMLIRHAPPNKNYNLNDVHDIGCIAVANTFTVSIVVMVTFIQSYYALLKA
jgi:hypothetical protein